MFSESKNSHLVLAFAVQFVQGGGGWGVLLYWMGGGGGFLVGCLVVNIKKKIKKF
jgi:hypothetical protein